jgi:hypothetical protein
MGTTVFSGGGREVDHVRSVAQNVALDHRPGTQRIGAGSHEPVTGLCSIAQRSLDLG